MTRIEHANITVPDIDEAIRFLQIIAPDFKVRKDVKSLDKRRWAHIGNDVSYIALQEPTFGSTPELPKATYSNIGVNHLALIVSDIHGVVEKLLRAGYQQNEALVEETYRLRVYFYDSTGFEWELVQYLSDKSDEMYLYE